MSGRKFLGLKRNDQSNQEKQKVNVEPTHSDNKITETDNARQTNIYIEKKAGEQAHLSEDVTKISNVLPSIQPPY